MPTLTTTYQGDMLFETMVGNHTLKIDVPAGMGGKDRGLTPPQLFISSLGGCVAALVANYCEKAGLDASGMSVDVSFDKVGNPVRLTNIRVQVKLPNTVCATREEAVRRVAAHCPVSETIETLEGIAIEILDKTHLADALPG